MYALLQQGEADRYGDGEESANLHAFNNHLPDVESHRAYGIHILQ